MKVEQFYNKNQFVIKGDGKIYFQSYNSTIALIQDGLLTLGEDWNYSNSNSTPSKLVVNQSISYYIFQN